MPAALGGGVGDQPLDRLLAAALYREQNITYAQSLSFIRSITVEQKRELIQCLLGIPDPHTIPARELENVNFTFDLLLDQGAYFEVKRHRMMTQTPQALTTRLGYCLPAMVRSAGFEQDYTRAMETAAKTYEKLAAWNPQVASYVVPNGYNRRVLAAFNLREAFHFCQLRSAANAHYSIRRIALRMAEEIRRVHPLLSRYLSLPEKDSWQSIEQEHFSSC